MSTTLQRRRLRVQIRWLIRRDMPEVLDIESMCFEYGWTEDDFLACLRQQNCIGMVAEHEHRIVGFMVYELHKHRLHVLNFAVLPSVQGCGVGAAMVQRLFDKLSMLRRSEISTLVRERNLDAQLFFRAQGFRCVGTLRDEYEDTGEDAYSFLFRLPECEVLDG